MWSLIGIEDCQYYGDGEKSTVLALFTTLQKAVDYESISRLKSYKVNYDPTDSKQYKQKSLLADCHYSIIEEYYPNEFPIDPILK